MCLLVIASYDVLLIPLTIGLVTRQINGSLLLDLVLMISFAFTVITCVYWGNLTWGRLALEILWIPWCGGGLVSFSSGCFQVLFVRSPIPR